MKRFIALTLAIALSAVCFVFSATAATETEIIQLITEDCTHEYQNLAGEITHSFVDTKPVIVGVGGYPYVSFTREEPLLIDPENTVLKVKVELSGGSAASIRLMSGTEGIYIHHYFTESTVGYDGVGDINVMGVYELTIDFSELRMMTADDGYKGKSEELLVDGDGNFILTAIQVWSVGSTTITFDTFELEVTTEIIDVPSEEPSTEEPSTEPTSPTGDSGYVALAVIAMISLAAVVVLKKVK